MARRAAVATRASAGWAFAFWTFANLMPRAVAYRKWYAEKFGRRYREEKAMMPLRVVRRAGARLARTRERRTQA